jgi:hypothetical protein
VIGKEYLALVRVCNFGRTRNPVHVPNGEEEQRAIITLEFIPCELAASASERHFHVNR